MTLDEKMIPIYVNLVRVGWRTMEQVPQALRPQVQALLDGGLNE